MRTIFAAVSALAALTLAASALAQPTSGVRAACSADIAKLCPGAQPGNGSIRQCIMTHRDQLSDELTSALRLLSPSQRAAVFLHYHADLPVSEVAALTGSSVPAVKVQLHRARRALRATLDVEEASGA